MSDRLDRWFGPLRGLSRADRLWEIEGLVGRVHTRWIRNDFAAFGVDSQVWPRFIVWGAERISLGSWVWIGPGTRMSAAPGAHISVGDGSKLYGGGTFGAHASIEIGAETQIGRNVTVVDHQHRTDDLDAPILAQGIDEPRPVVIGDGVWIGNNAAVMPGVTIGRNAVIGANAVVTRDVPDHAVAVGVPARVLERA